MYATSSTSTATSPTKELSAYRFGTTTTTQQTVPASPRSVLNRRLSYDPTTVEEPDEYETNDEDADRARERFKAHLLRAGLTSMAIHMPSSGQTTFQPHASTSSRRSSLNPNADVQTPPTSSASDSYRFTFPTSAFVPSPRSRSFVSPRRRRTSSETDPDDDDDRVREREPESPGGSRDRRRGPDFLDARRMSVDHRNKLNGDDDGSGIDDETDTDESDTRSRRTSLGSPISGGLLTFRNPFSNNTTTTTTTTTATAPDLVLPTSPDPDSASNRRPSTPPQLSSSLLFVPSDPSGSSSSPSSNADTSSTVRPSQEPPHGQVSRRPSISPWLTDEEGMPIINMSTAKVTTSPPRSLSDSAVPRRPSLAQEVGARLPEYGTGPASVSGHEAMEWDMDFVLGGPGGGSGIDFQTLSEDAHPSSHQNPFDYPAADPTRRGDGIDCEHARPPGYSRGRHPRPNLPSLIAYVSSALFLSLSSFRSLCSKQRLAVRQAPSRLDAQPVIVPDASDDVDAADDGRIHLRRPVHDRLVRADLDDELVLIRRVVVQRALVDVVVECGPDVGPRGVVAVGRVPGHAVPDRACDPSAVSWLVAQATRQRVGDPPPPGHPGRDQVWPKGKVADGRADADWQRPRIRARDARPSDVEPGPAEHRLKEEQERTERATVDLGQELDQQRPRQHRGQTTRVRSAGEPARKVARLVKGGVAGRVRRCRGGARSLVSRCTHDYFLIIRLVGIATDWTLIVCPFLPQPFSRARTEAIPIQAHASPPPSPKGRSAPLPTLVDRPKPPARSASRPRGDQAAEKDKSKRKGGWLSSLKNAGAVLSGKEPSSAAMSSRTSSLSGSGSGHEDLRVGSFDKPTGSYVPPWMTGAATNPKEKESAFKIRFKRRSISDGVSRRLSKEKALSGDEDGGPGPFSFASRKTKGAPSTDEETDDGEAREGKAWEDVPTEALAMVIPLSIPQSPSARREHGSTSTTATFPSVGSSNSSEFAAGRWSPSGSPEVGFTFDPASPMDETAALPALPPVEISLLVYFVPFGDSAGSPGPSPTSASGFSTTPTGPGWRFNKKLKKTQSQLFRSKDRGPASPTSPTSLHPTPPQRPMLQNPSTPTSSDSTPTTANSHSSSYGFAAPTASPTSSTAPGGGPRAHFAAFPASSSKRPSPFSAFRIVARAVDPSDLTFLPSWPSWESQPASNGGQLATEMMLSEPGTNPETKAKDTKDGRTDPTVVGVCHGHDSGVEFVREGWERLGFVQPLGDGEVGEGGLIEGSSSLAIGGLTAGKGLSDITGGLEDVLGCLVAACVAVMGGDH